MVVVVVEGSVVVVLEDDEVGPGSAVAASASARAATLGSSPPEHADRRRPSAATHGPQRLRENLMPASLARVGPKAFQAWAGALLRTGSSTEVFYDRRKC